jgi:hypothetical protein
VRYVHVSVTLNLSRIRATVASAAFMTPGEQSSPIASTFSRPTYAPPRAHARPGLAYAAESSLVRWLKPLASRRFSQYSDAIKSLNAPPRGCILLNDLKSCSPRDMLKDRSVHKVPPMWIFAEIFTRATGIVGVMH